jgi:hypothetical protein
VLEFNPEVKDALCRLCQLYPGVPFLALGQTIFWDEPTKAAFVSMLRECNPRTEFWHGIHDTDYFSRLPRPLMQAPPFTLVEHNDTSTRGLWVAVGEASRLFGSEALPTQARFRKYGCNLKKALTAAPELSLDGLTSTWGWLGLAATSARERVAGDVELTELGDELAELVARAMAGTIESLAEPAQREPARGKMQEILAELEAFVHSHPEANLSRLYQHLLPHFYRLLLGEMPDNVKLTASSELFRFNPETALRERFSPMGIFLNPATRMVARRAYDAAVTGSGIYTLDHFGPYALPFDLVIPHRGRGTIAVTPNEVRIHTPQVITLPLAEPVESLPALAKVIAENLGPDCALVGKAVIFILMITQEFMLVFHSGASAYMEHSHEMLEFLAKEGIELGCYPILRIRQQTWEAIGATSATLRLPEHLAGAFGREEITAADFSAQWREVVEQQGALLEKLAAAKKPKELLALFSNNLSGDNSQNRIWREKLAAYQQARLKLATFGCRLRQMQEEIQHLRRESYQLRQERQDLEKAKGRHFREALQPLLATSAPAEKEQAERRKLEGQIKLTTQALLERQNLIGEIRRRRQALASDEDFRDNRQQALLFEEEAEIQKVRLVRQALLTRDGLQQTNLRPTGWWFPLVSPGGEWFKALARLLRLETESLCPEEKRLVG